MIRELVLSLFLGTICFVLSTSAQRDVFEIPVSSDNQTSYAAHREHCSSNADCDRGKNMFCDVAAIGSVCSCFPQTAYDAFGKDCRKIYCSYNDKCPMDYQCDNGLCSKFCKIDSYSCSTTPKIYNRYDATYEIATWVVLGVIVAFVSVMLLTCLVKQCKRIRCKRVSTQHGQTVLVSTNSDAPLLGNETPTKVFSLCFCAKPPATTTSYMQRCHCQCDSTVQSQNYPIVVAPTEYKDLPPYYIVDQLTNKQQPNSNNLV